MLKQPFFLYFYLLKMNNSKDFKLTFSQKITLDDIIYMYWTQDLKPVFKNETLIFGLLTHIYNDITQGFSRMILQNLLEKN